MKLENVIYCGDNKIWLKKFPDKFVDLIYLDPPFFSNKHYEIIFNDGEEIRSFEDRWKGGINHYIEWMRERVFEMHRILKDTGSFYLHCDWHASHYLKVMCDGIFGYNKFRNEIVWWYETGGIPQKDFSRKHDIIFRYSKTDNVTFNPDEIKENRSTEVLRRIASGIPGATRSTGLYRHPSDVWKIPSINAMAKERLHYPTQKPEALLERIIKASSNKGDLILDPFCGCGTTIAVAQKLNRKWIGIDITYLAIDVIKKRLEKSGFKEGKDFKIEGAPADEYSARKLAKSNKFQFQYWAVLKIPGGIPNEKKTGDKGIDGFIYFIDKRKSDKTGKAIISVKGGEKVNPAMVRELVETIASNKADFGILITLLEPTKNMETEATKQGYFEYMGRKIPKVQIISIKDLFTRPIPLTLPTESIVYSYRGNRINRKIVDLPFEEKVKPDPRDE